MDIVRDKLDELGFDLEKIGNKNWPDHVYKWECSVLRDATYYIWITSFSNWRFKIELAKSPHEMGIDGCSRVTVFDGHISSESPMTDLDVILKCTGVFYYMTKGYNEIS